MELFRPRLTDYHGIHKSQADLDFAIQLFDEDIPLYVDPFLLWKSPSLQDQSLHTSITNSFNYLNYLIKKGERKKLPVHSLIFLNVLKSDLVFPNREKE